MWSGIGGTRPPLRPRDAARSPTNVQKRGDRVPSIFLEFALIVVVAWVVGTALAIRRVRLPELSRSRADAVFYVVALGYCVMLAVLSVMRHDTLHSHAFDLGIFDQILWNSARGHVMESSLIWDKATFFGNHISPTLLLFVPT